VTFLYSENFGEAYLSDAQRLILVLLAITLGLFLTFGLLFRNLSKGALVTAALLALLLIHKSFYGLVSSVVDISNLGLLALEGLMLLVLLFFTLRNTVQWKSLNKALNVVTGVLLALTVVQIISYGPVQGNDLFPPDPSSVTVPTEGFKAPEAPAPDVYFIMVDAYAGADALRDLYGYDNSGFISDLEARGFYVSRNSVANYNFTWLSLNTVMNYRYYADEDGLTESANNDVSARYSMKNRAADIFRSLGYRIVTIRSNHNYMKARGAEDLWHPSLKRSLNDFERAFYSTTAIPEVLREISGLMKGDKRVNFENPQLRNRVEFVINELSDQAKQGGDPKFVMAHIMSPHPPFIHDREGNSPKLDIDYADPNIPPSVMVEPYRDQVHYLNKLLRVLLDDILEHSSTPPIIVLQGDHGLRTGQVVKSRAGLEGMCLQDSFPNINAMYLPGMDERPDFFDTMSPVNTFRLILDHYFGGELGIINHQSFYFVDKPSEGSPFFVEVTGRENECSAQKIAVFKTE
jgi:hypothetical protein